MNLYNITKMLKLEKFINTLRDPFIQHSVNETNLTKI